MDGNTLSREGLFLIQYFEQLRLKPYRDAAGLWTIGWGHLIKPNEKALLEPGGITAARANQLLVADLQEAASAVSRLVTVPVTNNQYAALVSFVFNLGATRFASSTLLRKINGGDSVGALMEFDKWVNAGGVKQGGLVKRRAVEAFLFALPQAPPLNYAVEVGQVDKETIDKLVTAPGSLVIWLRPEVPDGGPKAVDVGGA